jgi:histidinol dehydrogenase
MVIADAAANPVFLAADLLSQAEHGADSQAILLTDSAAQAAAVAAEIVRQTRALPREAIVDRALAHARLIVVPDLATAFAVANDYAPEHLIVNTADARRWLPQIRAAGSVFLGPWSPEALGDYNSGTNHVLPTYGAARAYSGVSVQSFLRQITVQEVAPEGLRAIGPEAAVLARAEQLVAHERAITLRLQALEDAA